MLDARVGSKRPFSIGGKLFLCAIRKVKFFRMVTDGRVKRHIIVARRPRGTHKRGLRPTTKMKGSDVPLTDVILPHQKFDVGDFFVKQEDFLKSFLQAIDQKEKGDRQTAAFPHLLWITCKSYYILHKLVRFVNNFFVYGSKKYDKILTPPILRPPIF